MTKYKVNLIYTDNSESLDSIFIKVITKELKEYLNRMICKNDNNCLSSKSIYLSLKKGGIENER